MTEILIPVLVLGVIVSQLFALRLLKHTYEELREITSDVNQSRRTLALLKQERAVLMIEVGNLHRELVSAAHHAIDESRSQPGWRSS